MSEVFVLGAGFTKAFLPESPLMEGPFCIAEWKSAFQNLPTALQVLEQEESRSPSGNINIERLLTRLEAPMPYDAASSVPELALLRNAVLSCLTAAIQNARKDVHDLDVLEAFAKYCVESRATCITFNYDDLLDEHLFKFNPLLGGGAKGTYWHPDGGYGFFCQPADSSIAGHDYWMDSTSTYLLKLHGSLTWRVRKGYPQPHALDSVIHLEQWMPVRNYTFEHNPIEFTDTVNQITTHLEEQPLIVPPVLIKRDLYVEPIFNVIWNHAFAKLQTADKVTFIGYSLPVTDITASLLFGESMKHEPELNIVTLGDSAEGQAQVQTTYKKVFPWGASEGMFHFEGAADYLRHTLT